MKTLASCHMDIHHVISQLHRYAGGDLSLEKNITNSENEIFGIEQRKPHLVSLLLAS
jgi:hypothetical protein